MGRHLVAAHYWKRIKNGEPLSAGFSSRDWNQVKLGSVVL